MSDHSQATQTYIDEVATRFERAWRTGPRPRIEDYLTDVSEAGRSNLLETLIRSEQEIRRELGESPTREEYRRRFPGHLHLIDAIFNATSAPAQATPEGLGDVTKSVPPDTVETTPPGEQTIDMPRNSIDLPGLSTMVPGYEVLDLLGHGGMGVVYKARQIGLDRLVALKMIRSAALASEDELRRFQNEAEVVATLDHPHIVPILDVGSHEGQRYFTMKLVSGSGLHRKLADFIRNPAAAAQLMKKIAEAVHHAHQRGILHRDLKPANILLNEHDEPFVTDFGLAKRVAIDSELTISGAILGTPSFMSPEQASGRRGAVTTASDVYGLGAVLYALLTGRAPFRGDSIAETLQQVRESPPIPPSRINDHAPRDLEVICLKCLEKDPESRYESAAAVADELRRYLGNEPILARPVTTSERIWQWCRRNPSLAGAGFLAASGLVATAVIAILFAFQQSRFAIEQSLTARTERSLRTDVTRAFDRVKAERDTARTERDKANRLAATLSLRQGQAIDTEDDPASGLLWMARALKQAPDADLQHAIRANLSVCRRRNTDLQLVVSSFRASTAVAFSPDGKTILTASWHDGRVRLWSATDGMLIRVLFRPRGAALAMAFSPDGRTILTGSTDGTAQLWSAADGMPIRHPMQHRGAVMAMAFSPDGKTILTGGDQGEAYRWSAAEGELIGFPMKHSDFLIPVSVVALSPDGKTMLTGGADSTVRLWSAADGTPIGHPLRHQSTVMAVAFSPDGKTVITASADSTARLWSAADGTPIGHPLRHHDGVMAVAFSPDGKTVITASLDSTARLWSAADGTPIGHSLRHQSDVRAVAFSPDGKTVITGGADGTARLWSAADGTPIGHPLRHGDKVNDLAFSPDGKTILTRSTDGTAQLWSAAEATPIGQRLRSMFKGSVAFSPDSKTVITRSSDDTAQLWSAADGTPVGKPLKHQHNVHSMCFSPDGKTLATGSEDGTALLWDAANGMPVAQPLMHRKAVNDLAFSPDGKTILTGSADGTAQLWSAADGKPVGWSLEHGDVVWAVAFSPDGKTILTGSADGTARLWSTARGTPIGHPLKHEGIVWAAAYSPDGRNVVTLSEANSARVWPPTRPMPRVGAREVREVLTAMGTARLWTVPLPSPGDPERIELWAQVITGMELDQFDLIRVLDANTWQERRRLLQELGGPPMP